MKRDDLIIFIIGLLLLAGMLYTIFFGGEKSKHGVGNSYTANPVNDKTAYSPRVRRKPPLMRAMHI